MAKQCASCGKKIRFVGTKVKDGEICADCRTSLSLEVYSNRMQYTGAEIQDIIEGFRVKYPQKKGILGNKDDKFDEVRKYRRLCDEGLITEEEYEAKRRELLELE